MGHALVLNATYEPLCVVPSRRALVLVLNHKASSVEDSGSVLHSADSARGALNVEWDAQSAVLSARVITKGSRKPSPIVGDFVIIFWPVMEAEFSRSPPRTAESE